MTNETTIQFEATLQGMSFTENEGVQISMKPCGDLSPQSVAAGFKLLGLPVLVTVTTDRRWAAMCYKGETNAYRRTPSQELRVALWKRWVDLAPEEKARVPFELFYQENMERIIAAVKTAEPACTIDD